MGIAEIRVLFLLEIQASFFLDILNWAVGGFLGNFFGLEGVMEKCLVCFLVYLFWDVFFIKNRVMCNNFKKCIVTSFLCVFMVEEGICRKGSSGQLQNTLLIYHIREQVKQQIATTERISNCLRKKEQYRDLAAADSEEEIITLVIRF